MIVEVRMVQVDVFATGLLVFSEDLSVFVFDNPPASVKTQRCTVAADEVIDLDEPKRDIRVVTRDLRS